jgi:RsiW-degrading membrane proteinase PrsW (M82 family)
MSALLVLLFLLAISSLPVAIVYIWFRLAKYDFTLRWFLYVLLAGAIAFFPALLFQTLLPSVLSTGIRMELFYQFFIRIAFTEEASRLLMLVLFVLVSSRIAPGQPEFKYGQPVTWNITKKGAAAGLVAGLGFAVLESAVYGASNTGLLLLRAVTAAPLHAACGSRVGMAAVMIRTSPLQAIFRLLSAVAIHGLYNFMIIMPGFPSIAAVIIALMTLASSIATISGGWSAEEDPEDAPETTK